MNHVQDDIEDAETGDEDEQQDQQQGEGSEEADGSEEPDTDSSRLADFQELQRLEDEVQAVEDEDEFDDLSRWKPRVLERPSESLQSLAILFAPSAYDSLVALDLAHNAIEDLMPIVCVAPTLRLLNMNDNALAQLPGPSDHFWSKFQNLTLLFLASNKLATWQAMAGLAQCPRLMWLTVEDNPIMALVNAREFLINKLPPSLKALNDHVVTDVEYIKNAARTIRFGAQNVRLFIGDALCVPESFSESEDDATQYFLHTEASINGIYAKNSPTVITQRIVRGHLSRQMELPLFSRVRQYVVQVQRRVRGFLFRCRIHREFVALVTSQRQQDLLFGPMDDALFMTGGAHRGLRKLVAYVHQWRVKNRVKKQAIAVRKIRFWCQMVYQRYKYRSQQLLKEKQEIFIYYTPSFEAELLEMATKTVHRDPILMSMAPHERETLIRQRCIHSGVSVIRIPSQAREVQASRSPHDTVASASLRPPSTPQGIQRENAALVALKKTLTPPLVRIFRKDRSLEINVEVTAKHLIQQDMATLRKLKQQYDEKGSASYTAAQRRAVLLQISQLHHELEERLVIVNHKILTAVIQQKQRQLKPRVPLALSSSKIRVRGHAPTRPERRKMTRLLASSRKPPKGQGQLTDYAKMRVFIPWSIDMYLQMIVALDRVLLVANVSASFALSYEQTRQIHAAVVIQSMWRAVKRQSKRNALEVTILRAVVCLQRWWRYSTGLKRRMAFVRACLLLCGSINSPTLFMEEYVYRLLSDPNNWANVRASMRPCKEHALHCTLVNGTVELSLSPTQMLLYAGSSSSVGDNDSSNTNNNQKQLEGASSQRCGAYLPVWMAPGTPEHFEESMVSRDFDATPHLLVDRAHAEPTLIERELLLLGTSLSLQQSKAANSSSTPSAVDGTENPYHRFALSRRVAVASGRVMEQARKFTAAHRNKNRDGGPETTMDTATVISLVRLTFDRVEEARHRALVLLAKTFDPITHSYARLFPIEALVGATMLRHQWAVTQASGDAATGQMLLDDCKLWLQAELPSKWSLGMQARLPPQEPITSDSEPELASPSARTASVVSTGRQSAFLPQRPSPPPITAALALRPPDGPAPLHITESLMGNGIQPVPPEVLLHPHRPSTPSQSPSSFSRHQMLTNRLGKPTFLSVDDMRKVQLEDREYFVRDAREERERAMEAHIVDKRMIQREHAAELAGIKLDMSVKLQKIKYEQDLAKLQTRELVEREKMNERHRKLTHKFETSFMAQTGAMMRNAARRAVETKLVRKEETRKATSAAIRERDRDAMERRHDAKSYWFVSNQKAKQDVDDLVDVALAVREAKETKRQKQVHERIKEDKEIKQMLRLI